MTIATPSDAPICVAALYHFTRFDNCAALQALLEKLCEEQGLFGLLLLAPEGVNGTVAGSEAGIAALVAHIRTLPGCAPIAVKYSHAQVMPFVRMKVSVKREIVTMGMPDLDPAKGAGTYVEPEDWNQLIADPDTILIDTRNDYEVALGSFAGAIDPRTISFRDFPDWFRRERERLLPMGQQPKVAMFCTGGIRCEKSTAFLKQEGVENVFHLKGGILKYLEQVPEEQSLWQGECYVFDQRVSVKHGLAQGRYHLCFACRRPVDEQDRASSLFEEGVQCPACHMERSDAQRASYRERQRQQMAAKAAGRVHLGAARPSGQGRADER